MSDVFCFSLILTRLLSIFSVAPWIGEERISPQLKIFIAFCFSFTLYPYLKNNQFIQPHFFSEINFYYFLKFFCSEIILGLFFGFVSQFIFYGIQFGLDLIGNFMGFSSAHTYDPSQDSQTQIVSQFQWGFVILLFLALDAHHLLIQAFLKSYSLVHLGVFPLYAFFEESLIDFSKKIFEIALSISAPFGVAQFFAYVIFGFFSKALPQVNIFSLSLSILVMIGIFILIFWTPFFYSYLSPLFSTLANDLFSVFRLLKEN